MRSLCVFCLGILLLGCSSDRTYDVEGRVVGFGDDPRTVIIEHTEVEGYMPAMTMPFRAGNASSIAELDTGDAISFQLHVASDSSWIDNIEPLPDDAIASSPAGNQMPAPSDNEHVVLEPGDHVPEFSLVTQHEEEISNQLFQERPYVVTFIYTRCPLPDYCPLMSERFRELQGEIEENYNSEIGLLSVTVDPEYDTPDVLRDYASEYDANPEIWTLATGSPSEVERIANYLGVYYRDQGSSGEEVMHNLSTAVVDQDGRLHEVWRGSHWSVNDVLDSIEELR